MGTLFWIIVIVSGVYIVGTFVSSIISQGVVTFDWPLALLNMFRGTPRRG